MENMLTRVNYLRSKLASKRKRVNERYEYYDQKYTITDMRISTPPHFNWCHSRVGWCTKAVDSLANRLVFKGFENDMFDTQTIFNLNNSDIFFDSAILSSLISSCSFVYISNGEDTVPRLQVIDGANATGIIDPLTSMLKEGYAILDSDEYGAPTLEAYFTSDATYYFENGSYTYDIENPTLYPLLVPIIYRPSDKRPFGHARISRTCMDLCQRASRNIKRTEISSEYYSYPQKYILGLSDDVEIDNWKANISSMLALYRDDEGNVPTVGQFTQQSMSPYLDQMAELVKEFCGETGLTSDDLGFVGSNPSSAEAIKASHEQLRLLSRQAQRNFATGFLNVAYLAVSLRDSIPYKRNEFYELKAIWSPIFEPDTSMLSSIGDGAIKLNQAVEGFMNKDNLEKLTGIESDGEY